MGLMADRQVIGYSVQTTDTPAAGEGSLSVDYTGETSVNEWPV